MKKKGRKRDATLNFPRERWPMIEKAMQIEGVGNYGKNAWYVEIIYRESKRIVDADEIKRNRNAH